MIGMPEGVRKLLVAYDVAGYGGRGKRLELATLRTAGSCSAKVASIASCTQTQSVSFACTSLHHCASRPNVTSRPKM